MGLFILLVLAADIGPLLILFGAIRVVRRRRERGGSVVVPSVVACLAFLQAGWVVAAFLMHRGSLLPADPASKALLLSVGVSEVVNHLALVLVTWTPLLLIAWLVDRRLEANQRRDSESDRRG